jgi:2-oxoglutarate dehydrogenase E1 component
VPTAIVRVEQLYPFAAEEIGRILDGYPAARDFVWAQEEAQNMGAWSFVLPRLIRLLPPGVRLRYAGRVPSASPATGNANVHKRELADLLATSFRAAKAADVPAALATPRSGDAD